MGNLCGKPAKDNFEGQGRTLGSALTPATKASVPSNVAKPKPKVGGPARTLGEGNTPSGDLQKKLDAQKRQTQAQTLQQAATENRLARDADNATEARNYN
ncbi:hypothetical protein IQ07DRAFT_432951 [Pyrenochaeta sp. DS3sAY3a]|nr:hypothetical protein IQ07DRAFT_432951 [Pyrenochaeta sp. DS3sAY3a]